MIILFYPLLKYNRSIVTFGHFLENFLILHILGLPSRNAPKKQRAIAVLPNSIFNRLSNLPDWQMVCMVDLDVLESLLTLVFCCLHLSTHAVDTVQLCYTCIVLLLSSFTLHYTTSGHSAVQINHGCHLAGWQI